MEQKRGRDMKYFYISMGNSQEH